MSFGIPVRNGLGLGLTPSTALSTLRVGGRPAMFLNFIGTTSLSSMVTFTRGSNATLVDSTGKITYAPANLLRYSEQFDNAAWIKSDATVTANATTAPDGTSTADKLAETATTAAHYLYQSAGAAGIHTASIYAKAAERSWLVVTVNSSNTFFNLSNGTVGSVPGSFTAVVTDAGNGWYRCSVTATLPASGPIVFTPSTANNVTSYAGTAGSGIFLWGAQLEPVTYQTTPSTYVATTASAYYGPRFDYDPVTLAPKGLLIEQQRTNLSLHSAMTSANWTAVGGTIANTGKLSPDGSANMLRFTEDTATSAHQTFVTTIPGTFPALTPHTVSVYLAAGTRR